VRSGDPAYQHVSFDLDGTLVDSRADLAAAVNHVLGELGHAALPAETLQGFVGEGARRLVERALGADAPAALLEDALARFMCRYGQHLLDTTRPYPGVPALLEALDTWGVALSVLTNKPERMSRAILDGLGLGQHFVAVVSGDSLPTRKPDPAGVQHLLSVSGAARDQMLLVGDSAVDVRTARAAGIAFCGVTWGLTPDGMWAEDPERVIDEPADLLHVVAGA
jgi:phosphoglycolate phosphatase